MSPIPADAIERLAAIIKTLYTHERRRQLEQAHGVTEFYRPSRHWDGNSRRQSTWALVAHWVLRNKLNPAILVRSVFAVSRVFPEPNQLQGDRALEAYKHCAKKEKELIEHMFHVQVSTARAEIFRQQQLFSLSKEQAEQIVISDVYLQFTPLFRYCLAVAGEYSKLADNYHDPAVLQYTPSREDYDRVWGDLIPRRFRRLANEEYELILLGR